MKFFSIFDEFDYDDLLLIYELELVNGKIMKELKMYLFDKNKYIQTGGYNNTMNILIKSLKISSEEIPYGGEIISIIDVIEKSSNLLDIFSKTINKNVEYKELMSKLSFNNGPEGLVKILNKMNESDKLILKNVFLKLKDPINNIISSWISTIPEIGPVLSEGIIRIVNYNSLTLLYNKLPLNAKTIFENPDTLIELSKNLLINIKNSLKGQSQSGGNMFSNLITRATAPTMEGLKLLGLDDIVINETIKHLEYVLDPSSKNASKLLKMVFPLFFGYYYIIKDQ